jgi:hypothetical protein
MDEGEAAPPSVPSMALGGGAPRCWQCAIFRAGNAFLVPSRCPMIGIGIAARVGLGSPKVARTLSAHPGASWRVMECLMVPEPTRMEGQQIGSSFGGVSYIWLCRIPGNPSTISRSLSGKRPSLDGAQESPRLRSIAILRDCPPCCTRTRVLAVAVRAFPPSNCLLCGTADSWLSLSPMRWPDRPCDPGMIGGSFHTAQCLRRAGHIGIPWGRGDRVAQGSTENVGHDGQSPSNPSFISALGTWRLPSSPCLGRPCQASRGSQRLILNH